MMFELIEAVRGRLIGPKYWNRSVGIFGIFWSVQISFRDCFGCLDDNLLIKLYVGKYEAEKSHGIRFHQEEPM